MCVCVCSREHAGAEEYLVPGNIFSLQRLRTSPLQAGPQRQQPEHTRRAHHFLKEKNTMHLYQDLSNTPCPWFALHPRPRTETPPWMTEREASPPPVPETGSSEEEERDERMRGAVSRRDADAAKILKSLPVVATFIVYMYLGSLLRISIGGARGRRRIHAGRGHSPPPPEDACSRVRARAADTPDPPSVMLTPEW